MSYNERRAALLGRQEQQRQIRGALDRRAAEGLDPDAYWGAVIERLRGEEPVQEEDDGQPD